MYVYDDGKHDYKTSVGSHFYLLPWMIVALRYRLLAGEQPGLDWDNPRSWSTYTLVRTD